MSLREQFSQLIEQIAYLDAELNSDVSGELTEVISHAKAEGLSNNEIVELVEDRIVLLRRQHALEDEAMLTLVSELIERLPDVLTLN